jgi:hypothetical protein
MRGKEYRRKPSCPQSLANHVRIRILTSPMPGWAGCVKTSWNRNCRSSMLITICGSARPVVTCWTSCVPTSGLGMTSERRCLFSAAMHIATMVRLNCVRSARRNAWRGSPPRLRQPAFQGSVPGSSGIATFASVTVLTRCWRRMWPPAPDGFVAFGRVPAGTRRSFLQPPPCRRAACCWTPPSVLGLVGWESSASATNAHCIIRNYQS